MATLLHLEQFREDIGYHPYHFWQQANLAANTLSGCNSLVKEYAWLQTDSAGRADLRRAIEFSEQTLADWLHYFPAPNYVEEEIYLGCLQHDQRYAYVSPWRPLELRLRYGYVSKIGTGAWVIRDNGTHNFAYSDANGDSVKDLAKITFNLSDFTYSNLNDLRLAAHPDFILSNAPYSAGDWLLPPAPPIQDKVTPSIYYFQIPSWAAIRPSKYEGLQNFNGFDPGSSSIDVKGALDPNLAANFQTYPNIVEFVYSNPNKVTLVYDQEGTETSVTLGASISDKQNGFIKVTPPVECGNVWPCTCQAAPNSRRIKVNYLSGQEIKNWHLIITRLALAEKQRRICACDAANKEVWRWSTDMARDGGITEAQFKLSTEDLENPFGTNAGQIYAWKQVKNKRLIRAYNEI